MVDTREHSSKKPRISVSRRHIKRYSESSSWSPDQAKIMDIAVHEQAAQTTVVEAPTFWTKCNRCNIRYKYYVNVMGKVIRCRHCVEAFVANEIFPNANLGNQKSYFLSSYQQPANSAILDPVSCSPLQKNRLLADNGGVVQKIEYYGAENHGNESEVNGSATRMALAGEKLVESFNPDRSIVNSELLSDDLFKQGLQLMIKGFCGRARAASVEQLVDLLRYGNIILRSSADLSIPDPGLSALLENLKQQATDVISCQSSVTHSTAAHASLLDSVKVADFETSEAVALLTSIDEHVVEYTKRVERSETSLAEAKEKEEMARRARIQAEEDLARQKNELTVGEASREKAKHAWKEKDDASVKAKEEAVKGHDELQLLKKVLSASEAKWRSLCEEAPGVKDWVL